MFSQLLHYCTYEQHSNRTEESTATLLHVFLDSLSRQVSSYECLSLAILRLYNARFSKYLSRGLSRSSRSSSCLSILQRLCRRCPWVSHYVPEILILAFNRKSAKRSAQVRRQLQSFNANKRCTDPPDTVSIDQFMLDEKYGRAPLSESKNPFTCGITGRTYSAQEMVKRTESLARALAKEFGWSPNGGTEWDKVLGIFSLNTVSWS